MEHQDFKPIVFQRAPSSNSNSKTTGASSSSSKRIVQRTPNHRSGGGLNASSTRRGAKDTACLDRSNDQYKHDTVSRPFAQALQKARLSKKVTQKALAQLINEKPAVIASYESGTVIPNGAIINKLNRALGTSLPAARTKSSRDKKH